MGQVLHGSARTTPAVRRRIQQSPESAQSLAKRHGVNVKTVTKWRNRSTTTAAPTGPKPVSTVLTAEREAGAGAFRQQTQPPLDDGRYALQETIPPRARSALHRLFQRHGLGRLPAPEPAEKQKKFKDYPIGYLRVDFAEVPTEAGTVYRFAALDRTSKPAFAAWHPRATKMLAADFLRRVLAAIPYPVPKVLTDNGTQSGTLPRRAYAWRHIFDRVCDERGIEHGIEHRFTKPARPWTNGQRFNRTWKEATVRQYQYQYQCQTTAQLNEHLQAFLLAYNYGKRLERLRGKPPHELVCQQWRLTPTIFMRDPTHLMLGLYT
ncbi:DDE-type integrase/transposase/recombinase [Hymenobacter sp. PAMC 26628]|uniref:DDE-type integrase/transposase/recombinase n=1 Tax=Hymenobacter sp. PAMC 26628 TaxID=1484118 RepID=UPI0007706500|nr:DDE-type integrase/transposase/recombinase [Hymenobacter sp. PAMC 26628]AMJ67758.1 hypothetical protein AXW84_21785 [Hymenobacter sp. PAMC 26628]